MIKFYFLRVVKILINIYFYLNLIVHILKSPKLSNYQLINLIHNSEIMYTKFLLNVKIFLKYILKLNYQKIL